MGALAKELDGIDTEYAALTRQLDIVNAELQKKKLTPLKALSREDWEKKQAGE